jgi:acyl-CoA thioesterase-1
MGPFMMSLSPQRRDFILLASSCLAFGLSPALGQARKPAVILVVGDSISAEYGLKRGSGWVSLLEQRLGREKIAASVVNASISGDTTSGGRSRLPALLKKHQPTHVVIELGGNDALRGLPMPTIEKNLSDMIWAARETGARVLLVGIQIPPNYGKSYNDSFAAMYEKVSRTHKVPLVPFILKGVADTPQTASLFQPDRIHPNEQAQELMLDNVWPALKTLLTS